MEIKTSCMTLQMSEMTRHAREANGNYRSNLDYTTRRSKQNQSCT